MYSFKVVYKVTQPEDWEKLEQNKLSSWGKCVVRLGFLLRASFLPTLFKTFADSFWTVPNRFMKSWQRN